MHELKLKGITKTYKEKKAVNDIGVTFRHGVYGLLGENGAGKTTLMRMICGLLKPSSGNILCDNKEILKMGGDYRRILGYLPQDFGYYPDYSAWRFLMYVAALKALPEKYAKERIEELLELVNLSDMRNKKLKTFSGGMLKRVGIAQALLNQPELLILDEPTSGLDPKERVRFRNIISSLGKDKTVILSTHIVSDIEYIADTILMMKQGTLAASGRTEDILATISNKVWECVVPQKKADQLDAFYVVSNLKNESNGVLVRLISDQPPTEDAHNVTPTLEDAYLYYLSQNIKKL